MNPKLKIESYHQFGGLNTKFSPYILTPIEFLGLTNYDFQTPGSLSQRWGSTQYIGQTFAGPISALYEFARLDGSSTVIVGTTGAVWHGFTQGQLQGISFSQSATYFIGTTGSLPTAQFQDFIHLFLFPPGINNISSVGPLGVPYNGIWSSRFENQTAGETIIISGQSQKDNKLSFAVLNNYLFGADGNKFFKFDGTTTSFVTPPPPIPLEIFGASWTSASLPAGSIFFPVGDTLGVYSFYASYINDRGFEGNIWPINTVKTSYGNAVSLGASQAIITQAIAIPNEFNIQSINLYSYFSSGTSLISVGSTTNWNLPYTFLANYSISSVTIGSTFGITYAFIPIGTTVGNFANLRANNGALPSPITNQYQPIGFTLNIGATGVLLNYLTGWQITSLIPRFLEVYSNRLFLAGFSAFPNNVKFSDSEEPEGFEPAFDFEVRTNDGDNITAVRSYTTRFYIFKKNSFHVLTGDSPNNFFLQQISDQHGCLNNRCTIIFNDILLFLDRKGVVQFNGSKPDYISTKVQPYFDRMNFNAALDTAIMSHDKIRNQIMVAIPIDGSSTNNLTLVFDYIMNAWTTYAGFNASAFANIQGNQITRYPFYGDYNGRVNIQGPSLVTDNGRGLTLYFKTRFLHEMGDSVQKQFRRVYINANPPSATLAMPINFYQDYGSSLVYGTTFYLGTFQNRLEFGISAKSLAFELYTSGVTFMKIHGFTVEERLQRRV